MQERTIVCPILKKQIDDTICYDIHMNVEGLLPDWGVPKEVVCIPDYKRICMECKIIRSKYHQSKDRWYFYTHF